MDLQFAGLGVLPEGRARWIGLDPVTVGDLVNKLRERFGEEEVPKSAWDRGKRLAQLCRDNRRQGFSQAPRDDARAEGEV